jgi:hypothetical protein
MLELFLRVRYVFVGSNAHDKTCVVCMYASNKKANNHDRFYRNSGVDLAAKIGQRSDGPFSFLFIYSFNIYIYIYIYIYI